MIKRTVEISREPAHLAVRDEQLLVLRKDREPQRLPARPPNLAGSIPCEDLGVLMADHRGCTYSHHALAKLAEYGAAVVICGDDHHPVGMYLPLSTNTQLLARLDAQLTASKPTVKRLWQAIVQAKVRAQSIQLTARDGHATTKLLALARRVRSGDPENIEAQAAAIYWPIIFSGCDGVQPPFRRRAGDRTAPPPNNLLDYGYACIRASVARAIVAAGLLPALGIKHRGRSNPFCLADDLMEPLRPIVDHRVRRLCQEDRFELDQSTKAVLLEVLTEEVAFEDAKGPLLIAMGRYVASFVRVLTGESTTLSVPTWPGGSR